MIQSCEGKFWVHLGDIPLSSIVHFQFQLRVSWFVAVKSEQIS